MYNMAQKQAFMRDFTDRQSVVDHGFRLFEAIEPFEVEWGADFCTQPLEVIRPVVEKFCGIRDQSKARTLQILRGYADWCIAHGVNGARRDIYDIDAVSLDRLRREMIRVPAQLQAYLNAICDPVEFETTDVTSRTFLWLAFAGMRDCDIMDVRSHDVDLRRMLVGYGGREYMIYPEALQAVTCAATLSQFAYRHDGYTNGGTYIDRVSGDQIMRGIKSMPSLHDMRNRLSKKNRRAREEGATELELGYYKVWLSGMFYRKWTAEQAGIPVDFSAEAKEAMGDRVYRFGSGRNTQESKFREIVREYETDYQRWKSTFR